MDWRHSVVELGGVTVLWNWVALVVVVGWALAHQQTVVRYFGGLKPTLR
ncbi:TPA: hypothetical protein ACPJ9U_001450 [Haemophilus influenzae]